MYYEWLISEKEKLEQDIQKTRDSISKAKKEIALLEERDRLAQFIEGVQKDYYLRFGSSGYVDREKEAEIEKYIQKKDDELHEATRCHKNRLEDLQKQETEAIREIETLYAPSPWRTNPYSTSYMYYRTATERKQAEARERRWERERERSATQSRKNKEAEIKKIQKEYEDIRKNAEKNHVDMLKRLFKAVEIQAAFSGGISRENRLRFADLLTEINDECIKYGVFLVSYSNKISKLKSQAMEIPEDLERIDQEKEKTARAALDKKLYATKSEAEKTSGFISNAEADLGTKRKELENNGSALKECEETYATRIEQVNAEAAEKEQSLQEHFDDKKQGLRKQCEQETLQRAEALADVAAKISGLENEVEDKSKQKVCREEEWRKTFFLAFGKRKRLKEEVQTLTEQIEQCNVRLAQERKKREALEKDDPAQRMHDALEKAEKKLETELYAVRQKAENGRSQIDKQRADLLTQKLRLEYNISQLQTSLATYRESLKKQKQTEAKLTGELSVFHQEYLIATFGTTDRVKEALRKKRAEPEELEKQLKEQQAKLREQERKIAEWQENERQRKEAEREAEKRREELARIEREAQERELALLRKLKKALPEDFYEVDEAKAICAKQIPGATVDTVSLECLKSIGFLVRAKYVLKNWPSLEAYFKNLLLQSDTVDITELKERFGGLYGWNQTIAEMKREYDILEFEPNLFVTLNKLKKAGVTKQKLKNFCDAVYKFMEDDVCFTAEVLPKKGFKSKLYELGFQSLFYNGLLCNDPRFSSGKVLGTTVICKGQREITVQSFLVNYIQRAQTIDLTEMERDLIDDHGCKAITKQRIMQSIRSTEIYYDPILERLYANEELYYRELDEDVEET